MKLELHESINDKMFYEMFLRKNILYSIIVGKPTSAITSENIIFHEAVSSLPGNQCVFILFIAVAF